MKNKNRILKNYLNINIFNPSLLIQQKNLIDFYNNININNNIERENKYYSNINLEIKDIELNPGKEEEPKSPNIFNIRLNQTKEDLKKLSKNKWPNINICNNILELKGNVIKYNYINNIYYLYRKRKY